MRVVYSEKYVTMDLEGHIFPNIKYKKILEELLRLGVVKENEVEEPIPISPEDLKIVHDPEYIEDFVNLRWTWRTSRSEMPLNRSIVEGFTLMAGGTLKASYIALEDGFGYHIGGGFHHAYEDHAEGFCYVNDIAFAIKKLLIEGKINRAAVVDCDLHQGNGTAHIFRNEPRVFTFSIHQEYLYPVPKEKSDLDIGLPNLTSDEKYLGILSEVIPGIYDDFKPEFVVYQAGADPYRGDVLGDLMLSIEGLKKRDEIVLGEAHRRGIPVAITLGGGYAPELMDTVRIHVNTALVAYRLMGESSERSFETR